MMGGVEFSYREVGATRPAAAGGSGVFPAGYHHFRLRRRIGTGRELFERAADQVLAYRMQHGTHMFRSASTPTAQTGTEMTVRLGPIVAHCRVVYVLDDGDLRGFAYGTLAQHPEVGEELFAVYHDPVADAVYGVVESFSKPGSWYTRIAPPAVRIIQHLVAEFYIRSLPRA